MILFPATADRHIERIWVRIYLVSKILLIILYTKLAPRTAFLDFGLLKIINCLCDDDLNIYGSFI